jgi:hypothetical protein
MIGAAAEVLPVPPVPPAAELAGDEGDEDEDEELHPASARAAKMIAGKPARAPLRRDRVIIACLFWPDPPISGSRRGPTLYLMVTSPLETELRSVPGTCQACDLAGRLSGSKM